jgi:hypothetical protein
MKSTNLDITLKMLGDHRGFTDANLYRYLQILHHKIKLFPDNEPKVSN